MLQKVLYQRATSVQFVRYCVQYGLITTSNMFLTMATSNNNYNDQFKVQGTNIVKSKIIKTRFPPFLNEVAIEGNKRRAGLLG